MVINTCYHRIYAMLPERLKFFLAISNKRARVVPTAEALNRFQGNKGISNEKERDGRQ